MSDQTASVEGRRAVAWLHVLVGKRGVAAARLRSTYSINKHGLYAASMSFSDILLAASSSGGRINLAQPALR